MRSLTTLAILAMSAGTAAADHQTLNTSYRTVRPYRSVAAYQTSPRDLPQNRQPQTEERYQLRNKLADARLDAFHGSAFVQLPWQRGLDYLELRAGATPVALSDVVVRFADGSEIHTGSRGVVEPFEGRVIDLPENSAPVVAIIPQYQSMTRRGANLEVFGVPEHHYGTQPRTWRTSY